MALGREANMTTAQKSKALAELYKTIAMSIMENGFTDEQVRELGEWVIDSRNPHTHGRAMTGPATDEES